MKDYFKILADFYSEYNPEKVSEVPFLLNKYKGQEEALLKKLYEKYGISREDQIEENPDNWKPSEEKIIEVQPTGTTDATEIPAPVMQVEEPPQEIKYEQEVQPEAKPDEEPPLEIKYEEEILPETEPAEEPPQEIKYEAEMPREVKPVEEPFQEIKYEEVLPPEAKPAEEPLQEVNYEVETPREVMTVGDQPQEFKYEEEPPEVQPAEEPPQEFIYEEESPQEAKPAEELPREFIYEEETPQEVKAVEEQPQEIKHEEEILPEAKPVEEPLQEIKYEEENPPEVKPVEEPVQEKIPEAEVSAETLPAKDQTSDIKIGDSTPPSQKPWESQKITGKLDETPKYMRDLLNVSPVPEKSPPRYKTPPVKSKRIKMLPLIIISMVVVFGILAVVYFLNRPKEPQNNTAIGNSSEPQAAFATSDSLNAANPGTDEIPGTTGTTGTGTEDTAAAGKLPQNQVEYVQPENRSKDSPVIHETAKPAGDQSGNLTVYRIQVLTSKKQRTENQIVIEGKSYETYEYFHHDTYCYTIGEFTSRPTASEFKELCRKNGFPDAFVVTFVNNERTL